LAGGDSPNVDLLMKKAEDWIKDYEARPRASGSEFGALK
jgi:hypothetical protein